MNKRARHKAKMNPTEPRPGPHPGGPGRANTRTRSTPKRFTGKVQKIRLIGGERVRVEEKAQWKATQQHPAVRRAISRRRSRSARQARKANRP